MSDLKNVQWLTVAELAELWAQELKLPASVIEREIRIGLYKRQIGYPLHENIDAQPIEDQLPPRDTAVDRDFISAFCTKQYWKPPELWFIEPPKGPSFPGRPSIMDAIVHKLQELAANDQLEASLALQAKMLEHWAKENIPAQQTPKAKSIENGIRKAFKALKQVTH